MREFIDVSGVLGCKIRRSGISLARRTVAEEVTGAPSGSIPPVIPQIVTVLDRSALNEMKITVGSGFPGRQVCISPVTLLNSNGVYAADISTQAEVVWRNATMPLQDVNKSYSVTTGSIFKAYGYPPNQEIMSRLEGAVQTNEVKSKFSSLNVTLGHVEFLAKIARKRCVSKNLAFFSVVPVSSSNLSGWEVVNGSSVFRASVQLIAGATIQRILGRDAGQRLIRSIKDENVVRVIGAAQNNPSSDVIDIVCKSLQKYSPSELLQLSHFLCEKPGMLRESERNNFNTNLLWRQKNSEVRLSKSPIVENRSTDLVRIKLNITSFGQHDKNSKAFPEFILDGSTSPIHYVDDVKSLLSMERILSLLDVPSNRTLPIVIGIDCEWRPEGRFYIQPAVVNDVASNGKCNAPVAVFQLATRTDIFLCDMLFICRHPANGLVGELTTKERIFDRMISKLFNSRHVIKVGLGINQDLKRLAWSFPWIRGLQSIVPVLEIESFARLTFPNVSKRELQGISKLSMRLLQCAVNKDQQVSDWGTRPLSPFQRTYAAIDAFVLVKIFDALYGRHLEQASISKLDELSRNLRRVSLTCSTQWSSDALKETVLRDNLLS